MIYVEKPCTDPAELSEMAEEMGETVCQCCGRIIPDHEDYFVTPSDGVACEHCAKEIALDMLEDWRCSAL